MRIAVCGDLAFNDDLDAVAARWLDGEPHEGLDALRAALRRADLVLANFEGSVAPAGGGGPAAEGKFLVRAGARAVDATAALGVDVAGLANNHAFDHGAAALDRLPGAGIDVCGGGRDEAAATAPAVRTVGTARVAVLAWADRSTLRGIWAGPRAAGARADAADDLVAQVRERAAAGEIPVVLPHWGRDFFRYPSPAMRELGRRLIDAGAAAVVGTHPHVLGCTERHRGRPIVYSTGSLLLDDVRDAAGRMVFPFPPCHSAVATLTVEPDRTDVAFDFFRCARGRFEPWPAGNGLRILRANDRFLEGDDASYAARYARYERWMLPWGVRWATSVAGRPGAALRRWLSALARR